ncbi:hypothetical protein CAEBREN_13197 [Caenorhabditis brenneri]|uniref:Uncharacterized protein n=1 Tax=Caenorhabditis brenneri TaxID=135651 RepID=G0M7G4_CAEBE|nr:hypothetical protein CAEBREN_13197 [Caenorhabditis brenneri]
MLLVVAFLAFSGSASCAKVPRDEAMYTVFLDKIVQPLADQEQAERQKVLKFSPPSNYKGQLDRHGQMFITCFDTLAAGDIQGHVNHRCLQTSGKAEPVCAVTYDMKRNETQQFCFENPIQFPELCKDECEMNFKAYSYQGRNVYKGVGFCCCRTELCNLNAEKIVADGMAKADKNLQARLTNQYDGLDKKAYVPDLNWP